MERSPPRGSVEVNASAQRGILVEVINQGQWFGDQVGFYLWLKWSGFPLCVCGHLVFLFYGWNSLHIHSQWTLGSCEFSSSFSELFQSQYIL